MTEDQNFLSVAPRRKGGSTAWKLTGDCGEVRTSVLRLMHRAATVENSTLLC